MKRLAWLAFAHLLLLLSPGAGSAGTPSIPAPTNFTGAAVSTTSIQWSWDAVLGATHYELQEETTNTVIANLAAPPGTSPLTFLETGVSPGSTRCRHVVAFSFPDSASTVDVCVTTPTDSIPAPANFMGAVQSDTSILWSWDAVSTATSYQLQDLNGAVIATVSGPGSTPVTYLESNLSPNTQYCRRVVAANGSTVSSPSNQDCRTTTGQTVAAFCDLKITIKLLSRTVADDTIDYEYEVTVNVNQECLPAELKFSAKIVGDPKGKGAREPGGTPVTQPKEATIVPETETINQTEKKVNVMVLFKKKDIKSGLGKIVAGSEKVILQATLQSPGCFCSRQEVHILAQPNLLKLTNGTTAAPNLPGPTPCQTLLSPRHTMLVSDNHEIKVVSSYKVMLQAECIPGSLSATAAPFVVVNGQHKFVGSPKASKPFSVAINATETAVTLRFEWSQEEIEGSLRALGIPANKFRDVLLTAFVVVNSVLQDSCGCVSSISDTVLGPSAPGTKQCGSGIKLTQVSRVDTDEQVTFKWKARVTVSRSCLELHLPVPGVTTPSVHATLRIFGKKAGAKGTQGVEIIDKIGPLAFPLKGPFGGGDPIVTTVDGEISVSKALIALGIKTNKVTDLSTLSSLLDVSFFDACGCGNHDVKEYSTPNLTTLKPTPPATEVTTVPVESVCLDSISPTARIGVSEESVTVTTVQVVRISDPECVPGELTIDVSLEGSIKLKNGSTVSLAVASREEEVTVKSTQDIVDKTFTFQKRELLRAIEKTLGEVQSLTEAEILTIYQNLGGHYHGILVDACGCAASADTELARSFNQ